MHEIMSSKHGGVWWIVLLSKSSMIALFILEKKACLPKIKGRISALSSQAKNYYKMIGV